MIVSGLLVCPVASSFCIPRVPRSIVTGLGFVVLLAVVVVVVFGAAGGFSLSMSWSSWPMLMVVGLLVPLMLCGVLNPRFPK